jgi:hypothetical protein
MNTLTQSLTSSTGTSNEPRGFIEPFVRSEAANASCESYKRLLSWYFCSDGSYSIKGGSNHQRGKNHYRSIIVVSNFS